MADLDWGALMRPNQTVGVYMGLNALPDICRLLMAHGALATQQVLTGTLADLPAKVAGSGFASLRLLIVGDVVRPKNRPKNKSVPIVCSLLANLSPLLALGDDSRLTHSGPVQLPINPAAAN